MESVSFKLPEHMVARLAEIAANEDVSVGQVIRLAIEREFARRDGMASHPRTPPHLLAPIRDRVRADFIEARSWGELKTGLVARGYSLREAGGGLALHDAITGRFLCRTSEIGFGYPALLRRFQNPFPGHSQTALLNKIQAAAKVATQS